MPTKSALLCTWDRLSDINGPTLATSLRQLHSNSSWCIDSVKLSGERVTVDGWLVPASEELIDFRLTANGADCDEFQTGLERPDVGRLFWYRPRSLYSGFRCAFRPLGRPREIEFRLLTGEEEHLPSSPTDYFLLEDQLPLPGSSRQRRVCGGDDEVSFRMTGYSSSRKLGQALSRFFNADLTQFSGVLDWGCGCGRVSRYLVDTVGTRLTGVDIDQDNVDWCHRNLSPASFSTVPLSPPSRLSSNGYDLAIGISVLTHLGEQDQFRWLEELHRLVKPGGIIMLSVLSDGAICRAGINLKQLHTWRQRGFCNIGVNNNLDGCVSRPEYFNVVHSKAYIREKWGHFFRICEIVPECIGNHQDLVIMQR